MKHLYRSSRFWLSVLAIIAGLLAALSPLIIPFDTETNVSVICAGVIVAVFGILSLLHMIKQGGAQKEERKSKGGALPKALGFWVIVLLLQLGPMSLRSRCFYLLLCIAMTAACAIDDHKSSQGIDEKGILSLILSTVFFVLFILRIIQVGY